MENGGEYHSSRGKYRSPSLESPSSRAEEEDRGIGVANGEGKLGLDRMCSIPFSLNRSLRLIVVGSVLSLAFVGVLFVWTILRVLVRPCSRRLYLYSMDVIQGQVIEMLVLLLPRATIHITGLSHLPDGPFPAAMISNRVISTCRGREAWALVVIAMAIGRKERIRLVGSKFQGLHECLIEEVAHCILSQFHFWAHRITVGKVISDGPSNVHAPERNACPVSNGDIINYKPPLFIHFPEGGFDISVFSNGSLKRSVMRPGMKHLLVPHVQTTSACMKALGSKGSPVLYDVTLVEPNAPPLHKPFSWFEAICIALSCPLDLHAHVNCYPLTAVLDNSYWLENKWEEKDKIIAYFRRHNRFPDINSITVAPPYPYTPSLPATIGAPPCKSIVLDTGTWQFCESIQSTILLVFISLATPLLFLLFLPVVLLVCALGYVNRIVFSNWVVPG